MAITATLSVNNTTPTHGIAVRWALLVSNSGGSPVNILDICMSDVAADLFAQHSVLPAAAMSDIRSDLAAGQSVFAPSGSVIGQTQQVPAGGSITLSWAGTFFLGARTPSATQTQVWPVAVVVRTDDGSITQSNTVNVTVSPMSV